MPIQVYITVTENRTRPIFEDVEYEVSLQENVVPPVFLLDLNTTLENEATRGQYYIVNPQYGGNGECIQTDALGN